MTSGVYVVYKAVMAQKPKPNIKEKIIKAALKLAAMQGWAETSLGDIARACKISLSALRAHFDDKADIVAALGRMVDRRVLDRLEEPDADIPLKERVFDVLMERYDVLNDYRAGIVAILESFASEPKQAVITLPHLCRSMNWMLEGAGVETGGLAGAVRLAGVTLVYAKALWIWKDDDSADMAKTMAALDKYLEWADRLANRLGV